MNIFKTLLSYKRLIILLFILFIVFAFYTSFSSNKRTIKPGKQVYTDNEYVFTNEPSYSDKVIASSSAWHKPDVPFKIQKVTINSDTMQILDGDMHTMADIEKVWARTPEHKKAVQQFVVEHKLPEAMNNYLYNNYRIPWKIYERDFDNDSAKDIIILSLTPDCGRCTMINVDIFTSNNGIYNTWGQNADFYPGDSEKSFYLDEKYPDYESYDVQLSRFEWYGNGFEKIAEREYWFAK